MIPEELKPKEIYDIVVRMDEYLDYMRKDKGKGASEFVSFLVDYTHDYFKNEDFITPYLFIKIYAELKKLAVKMVDDIYCKLMQFSITDLHTNAYFGIVLNGLFFELEQKEIYLFYIVDNKIRDDRFKILEQMFRVAHFVVIYPYAVDKFEHTQEYTKLPTKSYEKVKQEIDDAIANKQHKKHILYVEKDDSVNYIKEVLEYALESQKDKYACMFRNETLDKPAHYLTTWKNMPEEKYDMESNQPDEPPILPKLNIPALKQRLEKLQKIEATLKEKLKKFSEEKNKAK